ncbi:NADH-cytochrome b5 reductase [Modicella reniformis]|uniref:cytochrome-b5 reductase n=1 Tax=Modicella reniformis TaxID=1440133 RepID=A0A9P6M781_9FUNG|nr:NADH-cytochrome b5 reductase [Modicella reniformis]
MRAYTPIHHSIDKEQDRIQLLIKRYDEGQVSRFIHSARPGKKIEMRGPILIWPASRPELEIWDEIGMIAGGTGITAMMSIIHSVLTHPDKKIKISLLFAAQSPEELYFKDELDQLSRTFSDQFRVAYTVDRTPTPSSSSSSSSSSVKSDEWKGHIGYVNDKMLKELMPAPNRIAEDSPAVPDNRGGGAAASKVNSKKSIVLICGPESMVRHVAGTRGLSGQEPIRGILGTMGYQKDQVFRFPN